MGISTMCMRLLISRAYRYKIAYNAAHLPSVEACQNHTRLLSNENQLTNQAPNKITHFIGGELDRVDRKVPVVMIQFQVVPHY